MVLLDVAVLSIATPPPPGGTGSGSGGAGGVAIALLAQRQLQLGHVDAACQSWGCFLAEYEQVSSARGDDHFHAMRKSMRPHQKAHAVRELAEHAREVAMLKA
ncbi:hypothetical protein CP970_26175 [Streptomyces kanamyceticus]|uniref:Uncharacterized protein n=1 Tax=Streptomyces kanamyceticus TaxID=1967 RepID=A0A5J6GJD3_STRKN|nr:hypothetical protein CP970_26175 [Streptomyces kanamyceticus]